MPPLVSLVLVAQMVNGAFATARQDHVSAHPVSLSITDETGRVVRHVVTTRSNGAWTPLFSKTADWRSPEGLAVSAIRYQFRLEKTGVRVDVSVMLGQPHQKDIQVASALVERDRPIRIARLRDFGVSPVLLTIGEIEPSMLTQPQIENRTAALQVEGIDIATEGPPGYHLTVRNYSAKPVMTFFVEAHRGGQRAQSGRRGERDGTPAVAPGGTYRFFVSATDPLDLIAITGLMFEDASVEGDANDVALTRLIYLGRQLQLGKIVAMFERAGRHPAADPAATVASLVSEVEALSVLPDAQARQRGATLLPAGARPVSVETVEGAVSSALFEVRSGVLSDLTSAPRDRDGFARWLSDITAQYARWHQRFRELTAP